MDYDVLKIFVSAEVAIAFGLAYAMSLVSGFFVAVIFGFVDIIVAKYKKNHDLK